MFNKKEAFKKAQEAANETGKIYSAFKNNHGDWWFEEGLFSHGIVFSPNKKPLKFNESLDLDKLKKEGKPVREELVLSESNESFRMPNEYYEHLMGYKVWKP